MKKLLIIILFLPLLNSCAIKKNSNKNKEDRTIKEQTETIIKRVGDTVSYTIPKFIIKDTTIYTTNRQGTTLKTVYDNSGRVSEVDCFSSYVEEITRSNKEVIEAIKTKEKGKEESIDSKIVLYFMIGLALIVGVIGIFLFRLITKHSALIEEITKKAL